MAQSEEALTLIVQDLQLTKFAEFAGISPAAELPRGRTIAIQDLKFLLTLRVERGPQGQCRTCSE